MQGPMPALDHFRTRARALWNLGRAVLCNRTGRITWPSLAHLYVTWRCNLRCSTCSVWKENRYPELSTDGMLRVIDELRCLDIVKVTGGEPFLRDDLEDLVAAIQQRIRPTMLHIVSNGTFPDRMERLASRLGNPALHIRISLEGGEAVHNQMRGQTWAFARTWESLERLAAIRRRYRFNLGVNYHLCEETLPDLPRMVEYCRSQGLDLVPGLATYPFLEDRYEEVLRREPPHEEQLRLLERFGEVWSLHGDMLPWEAAAARRQAMRAVEDTLGGQEARRFQCRELRNLVYVLPDGNIVTCGLKHRPIGSLVRESLADIWFGERITAFRREVEACPGCWQDSVKMTSRIYNGDFRRPRKASSPACPSLNPQ